MDGLNRNNIAHSNFWLVICIYLDRKPYSACKAEDTANIFRSVYYCKSFTVAFAKLFLLHAQVEKWKSTRKKQIFMQTKRNSTMP